MSDLPPGYRDIPDEDRQKAQKFFEQGKSVADRSQFDYAIEMILQGLDKDPENTEAHQVLREISLKRKASGGKGLGFMDSMKLKKAKDDKQAMLNAEKMLAYDPGDLGNMTTLFQAAHKAGFYDTVVWIGNILTQANISRPKGPDYKTFIILRDVYKTLHQWQEAVDACQWAAKLRPDDMDLQKELKDLATNLAMLKGKYGIAKSFRDSIRNMDKQQELMESDSGIQTEDILRRQIAAAKVEYEAEPNEPGKLMKYVDALRKTENLEHENIAIELLEETYKRTSQFRWRKSAGELKLAQLNRMDRSLRQQYVANPADEEMKKEYLRFRQQRAEEELKEYTLWVENYPTESSFKHHMATRLMQLKRYDEAIPLFQQVRQDPKLRVDSGIALGKAFMEAGFMDEAADTLRDVIEAYPLKGDEKSIDMTYTYGRALEAKGDAPAAIKQFSQVAQWNFNYKDVQSRIKALRAAAQAGK